jgi:hypothetical protein
MFAPSGSKCSEHQWAIEVERGLCAQMFHARIPIGTQLVEPQAIGFGVDFLDQSIPQFDPLRRIDVAFEHGILDALAEVTASARHASQPPLSAIALGRYIICNQNHHRDGSLPNERRIGVQVASDVAGEQLCLNEPQETQGHPLIQVGMVDLIAFSFLVSNENGLPALVCK